MSYVFRGSLRGALCENCSEVPAGSTIRLYRHTPGVNSSDILTVLTDDQIQAKASLLIAETTVNSNGNFSFRLDRAQKYKGEAFEIDLYCATVPYRRPSHTPPKPRQFSIATLQPVWELVREDEYLAAWQYEIPYSFWSYFRGLFDAWVICGRLTARRDQSPIAGATISAFDVNWLYDNALGSAVTDDTGHFRIDYLSEDFNLTPFSPWIDVKRAGGPDVYFKATLAGTIVLEENRSIARVPERKNIGPCCCIELFADKPQRPAGNGHGWQSARAFDAHPAPKGSALHEYDTRR